jgi:glycosyltransferase involved in cell wall biosynthesis
MKILELTNFSAGICGVWSRVREEALRLSRNHEVRVFSSNFVKGNGEIAESSEKIGDVIVTRFPAKKIGGESFMSWNFEREAEAFRPNIIIAHSYRHGHTERALKIGRRIGARVFLVTHAPFVKGNVSRDIFGKLAVKFYDRFKSGNLRKFDRVIAIPRWEIPFLHKLGVRKDKISYVPNGIPEEFFKLKASSGDNKILFLGRISPIKNLETLIYAVALIKDKKVKLELVGPAESDYLINLKKIVSELRLKDRVLFSGAIYDIKEKIRKIDSAKVFVLPSKSEAMPQSLIEALARERVVIASDNRGSMDLIKDRENGFLFRVGDVEGLARKIEMALELDKKERDKIKREGRKSVEKFEWDKVIEKLEGLF